MQTVIPLMIDPPWKISIEVCLNGFCIRRPHKMFPMKIEDWSTIGVPLVIETTYIIQINFIIKACT